MVDSSASSPLVKRASGWFVAGASALGAIVLPKCPLCLAGYLSVLGVSVGGATMTDLAWIRFGLAATAVLVGGGMVVARLRRRRASCCATRTRAAAIATPL